MWLRESNRLKHLSYAIPCGILGTILFVAGLALGMEFKDKQWGGKWDWLDVAAIDWRHYWATNSNINNNVNSSLA